MTDRWQCMVCGYIHEGPAPPARCPLCGAPFTAFEREGESLSERLQKVAIIAPRPAGYRYVIIGNSAAGRSAARALQALDTDGEITVLSEEPGPLYVRPLLPDFIGGLSREDFFSAGEAFAAEGLRLLLGDRAERLDVITRQVLTANGRVLPFDALLLATGSAPIQIPWPGSDAAGIAYFRTFADAEKIAQLARGATQAVVVGGGFLGLEFVRAFLSAGLPITQLIRQSYVGAPALDESAGALLQKALEALGVTLALEEEVASFEVQDGRVCGVQTSQGRTLACDLVGVAVGARPRVELAREAGLEIDRGILVDRRFQTSVPDIYAAGDVAQALDRVYGEPRVNTSWRNSQEQGELAGIAMAGGAMEYPGGIAANYQLTAGIPFCALGIAHPPSPEGFEIEVQIDEAAGTYRKTVRRDGGVVGAVLLGDLSQAGDLEQQLRQGKSPAKIGGETGPQREPVTLERKEEKGVPETLTERKTTMHKMTEENIKAAFAGESQAHVKYLNFAETAAKEGKENVARLFRAASFAEQVHATGHLKVLGGIQDTGENLAAAMAGEDFEVQEMYPAYRAVAVEQGEEKAQKSIKFALDTEKMHYALYQRAKQAVDAGGDLEVGELWVCPYCGCTMDGEAPEKCPLCGALKKAFVQF